MLSTLTVVSICNVCVCLSVCVCGVCVCVSHVPSVLLRCWLAAGRASDLKCHVTPATKSPDFIARQVSRDKVAACDFIVARCDFDAASSDSLEAMFVCRTLRQSRSVRLWRCTLQLCRASESRDKVARQNRRCHMALKNSLVRYWCGYLFRVMCKTLHLPASHLHGSLNGYSQQNRTVAVV